MRAIDFWVILCYIGEFAALMEYIVVLHLTQFFMAEDGIDNRGYIPNKGQPITGSQNPTPAKSNQTKLLQ